MRMWTERQGELRGHYEINLAATALLQLLALRHPALAAVQARSLTQQGLLCMPCLARARS